MPFAEGEGLWGTVWRRGGGGMGWGVGGCVGGGRDSPGKSPPAMVVNDDDVSTVFFFFPAVLVPHPQSLPLSIAGVVTGVVVAT